ncbi:formate/nitrite transporter family protein [Ewingella americana]|uniref:Nitrite transporter NirC n=1 Tax=Ewingella americana TaxID=41202 RepID=A0A502GDI2_9GAMM|nr:formate/nitrite transporter family protein [Ewingella americana]TPG59975.1 nitrite transporter NirC [Ewingella americana]
MYTIKDIFNTLSNSVDNMANNTVFTYLIRAMLGGVYIGIGIILIFTLGNTLPPEFRPLIMGATFGIALTLILVAGAYLYTGHTFVFSCYILDSRFRSRSKLSFSKCLAMLCTTWVGNLLGAMLLAYGIAHIFSPLTLESSIVHSAALAKVTFTPTSLILKGFFCNLLVCLAIWMWNRLKETVSGLICVWWCLLAFIACGFEHSVANMTLLFLSYFGEGSHITLGQIFYNLGYVTLGNTLAGFVLAYCYSRHD